MPRKLVDMRPLEIESAELGALITGAALVRRELQ
jgi:hypothetical protein